MLFILAMVGRRKEIGHLLSFTVPVMFIIFEVHWKKTLGKTSRK